MIRLIGRRAHTERIAAASPLHSAASSAAAASALSPRSLVQSRAVSASLRCAAAVSCVPSPLLLRFACAATNAATLTTNHQARRSLHCSRQTQVQSEADGRSDATSKGQQARQPPSPPRGSPSKNEHPREAQEQRPNDRATHRTRPHGSAPLTGKATTVGPFRFDAQSDQSEEQQRAFHQLAILRYQYTDKFPTKAQHIAGGINDITRKQEWQSMRSEARKLLALLLKLSPTTAGAKASLTVAQCESMLHHCKQLRLVEEPLFVLRALGIQQRISAKCVSMLLECIVKSPEWAAQTGDIAPCGSEPAVGALCAGRPPPSAELRGVELAQWMLATMLSPTLRDRFEVDVFAWNSVLHGLIQAAHRDPIRLQRARGFYDRIPNKNGATHGMMIDSYQRAGMDVERDALQQLMEADPTAAASPQVANAQLANIYSKLDTPQRRADRAANRPSTLTAEERAQLQKASQLWSMAKQQPATRMNEVVTGSMLKVLALLGDIPLMMAVIREAIKAEWDQIFVLVHPPCYGLLFDSMSESADPASWKAEANDAWTQMLQRHTEAEQRRLPERAKTRADEAVLSVFARYLQLTDQSAELESLWRSTPRHLKEGNEQLFLARLKVLAKDGDAAAAQRIIGEMPSFNVRPHVQHFAAWLSCHTTEGRWAAAERVWQRMLDSSVKPEPYCYRELMLVYMHDGSPAQLAKIERLDAEMRQTCPAGMSVNDYQRLIKTAQRCRSPSEVREWSERAKRARVWKQLDAASHTIVATIDHWKDSPRDSKSM